MKNLHLQFLLAFSAGWVNRSQQALIEYLKTENEIYRDRLGHRYKRLLQPAFARSKSSSHSYGVPPTQSVINTYRFWVSINR